MWKVLLFVFTLNFVTENVVASQLDAPELVKLRIQGYQLVTQLLQSHNPNIERNKLTKPFSRDLEKYQAWRSKLSGLGSPLVNRELEILSRAMKELGGLTADRVPMLPAILNPVLQAQAVIDQYLQEEVSKFDREQNENGAINRQLVDIARFGLYYQTRIFNGLMIFSGRADANLLVDLDDDIRHRFEQLSLLRFAGNAQLERSQTHYEFVSRAILQSRSGWIPSGAMYYLNKSTGALLAAAGYSTSHGLSQP